MMTSLVPVLANALAGPDGGDDDPQPRPPRPTSAPAPGRTAPSTSNSAAPAKWLERPSLDDATNVITSRRALAKRADTTVTFLDPLTGAETGKMTAISPTGVTKVVVDRVTLVDTESDTLVVFYYRATYPESGLDPERKELRVQVRSRASGQQLYDTPVVLGGEPWLKSTWQATDVVASDPRGYVVLNYLPSGGLEDNLFLVLGLRPELKSWRMTMNCCPRSVAALALNGNVLLVSHLDRNEELRGYDLVSGRQLWSHPYKNDSITERHPECSFAWRDSFVLRGRDVPLVLKAGTGAVVAGNAGYGCMTHDPASSVAIDRTGSIDGLDLATGKQLWTIPPDQWQALDLELVSVYDDRVYVTTKTARLVLDARTGKEVSRDWKVAPVQRHDGWVIGYDAARKKRAVYPGNA
jgi:hypothetical protein